MGKYRKAFVAVAGAALAVIPAALAAPSWQAAVIAGVTALAVYLTPNKPA